MTDDLGTFLAELKKTGLLDEIDDPEVVRKLAKALLELETEREIARAKATLNMDLKTDL